MSVVQLTTADFRLSDTRFAVEDDLIVIGIAVWQQSMCSDYALEFTSVQDKEYRTKYRPRRTL